MHGSIDLWFPFLSESWVHFSLSPSFSSSLFFFLCFPFCTFVSSLFFFIPYLFVLTQKIIRRVLSLSDICRRKLSLWINWFDPLYTIFLPKPWFQNKHKRNKLKRNKNKKTNKQKATTTKAMSWKGGKILRKQFVASRTDQISVPMQVG